MERVLIVTSESVTDRDHEITAFERFVSDEGVQVIIANLSNKTQHLPLDWLDLARQAEVEHLVQIPVPCVYPFDELNDAPDGTYWCKDCDGTTPVTLKTDEGDRRLQWVGSEWDYVLGSALLEGRYDWLKHATFFGPILEPAF